MPALVMMIVPCEEDADSGESVFAQARQVATEAVEVAHRAAADRLRVPLWSDLRWA